ncbi:MAG TPA: RagB/SusD family nutrient uptake outer membrane protein [Arachidicoccus sp.]|nr:RagB/SusD family nutrient uptake outer membrane protein [Arachidicoccus sp.]
MKHNIIKQLTLFLLLAGGLASCSKSFLELNPKGEFVEETYYKTPEQAFAALVACYAPLTDAGGGVDGTYANTLGPLNSGSDECWAGGGGPGDMSFWQAMSDYHQLTPQVGPQGEFWGVNYQGIFRCNVFLQKLKGTGVSEADSKRYSAEVKFLRAHYYFDLERCFKNIILTTEPLLITNNKDVHQTTPDSVYAQIEKDLKESIVDLPPTVGDGEKGRVTQGAAIALLGKVYLYEKKWAEAASQLIKVNGPTPGGAATPIYGYKLLSNYGDIFSPAHKFNTESIFELSYSGSGKTDWGNWFPGKGNVYVNMVGPRNYNGPTYFGGGWSFNPIIKEDDNALLYAMHPKGSNKYDPRYKYTILNLDSLTAATKSKYDVGYKNTGYFIRKYAPLTEYRAASGVAELNFPNDYIEIRLADTYLMEAEALIHAGTNTARAQQLLDAVRARVALPSVSVSLDNIYKERRLELATEGHRWYDLIRTGRAAATLAFKGFTAGKNELLPIPFAEMELNANLKQNPGYTN